MSCWENHIGKHCEPPTRGFAALSVVWQARQDGLGRFSEFVVTTSTISWPLLVHGPITSLVSVWLEPCLPHWWCWSSEPRAVKWFIHLCIRTHYWAPAPCQSSPHSFTVSSGEKSICALPPGACGPEGGIGTDWLYVECTSLCSSCDQSWELQVDDAVIEELISIGFSQAFLKAIGLMEKEEYGHRKCEPPWMKVVQPPESD